MTPIIWFFLGLLFGIIVSLSVKKDRYWKGRLEGWQACEQMILSRAERISKKYKSKIWKELIQ